MYRVNEWELNTTVTVWWQPEMGASEGRQRPPPRSLRSKAAGSIAEEATAAETGCRLSEVAWQRACASRRQPLQIPSKELLSKHWFWPHSLGFKELYPAAVLFFLFCFNDLQHYNMGLSEREFRKGLEKWKVTDASTVERKQIFFLFFF